jgi:hypothetical protein
MAGHAQRTTVHPSVEAVESRLEAFQNRTVFVIRHAQVPR